VGSASSGGRRSITSTENAKLRGDKIDTFALLTLDLPIERTEERDNYRNSLISMEQILRNKNLLEDQIKLEIRDDLRELLQARESVQIQAKSVEVAKIRIESTKEFWSLGRAVVRDILEAQDSQLSAKNSLTSAVISYRIAELSLQRDMGLLKVGADGKWQEFSR
jgi:outer membrane protein TolC